VLLVTGSPKQNACIKPYAIHEGYNTVIPGHAMVKWRQSAMNPEAWHQTVVSGQCLALLLRKELLYSLYKAGVDV